jgi:hypothetical protein
MLSHQVQKTEFRIEGGQSSFNSQNRTSKKRELMEESLEFQYPEKRSINAAKPSPHPRKVL